MCYVHFPLPTNLPYSECWMEWWHLKKLSIQPIVWPWVGLLVEFDTGIILKMGYRKGNKFWDHWWMWRWRLVMLFIVSLVVNPNADKIFRFQTTHPIENWRNKRIEFYLTSETYHKNVVWCDQLPHFCPCWSWSRLYQSMSQSSSGSVDTSNISFWTLCHPFHSGVVLESYLNRILFASEFLDSTSPSCSHTFPSKKRA